MHKPPATDADLARLKDERDRADRLYNEALTALDQGVAAPRDLPGPPEPGADPVRDRLNQQWRILPDAPVGVGGWRGRLAGLVWRVVGPFLQQQQAFNAAVAEHANRLADREAASRDWGAALARVASEDFVALSRLQARLIAYLQQITLYVDTKDRFEDGCLWHELEQRTRGLAAGLDALGDELLRRREHIAAQDRRVESWMAELRALAAGDAARLARTAWPSAPGPAQAAIEPPETVARGQLADAAGADAGVYSGFEDLYRGPTRDIKDRLAEYLPLFAGAREVVDLGCGRGEFLQALAENGIPARGVDLNAGMVDRCRALGLDVVRGEAIAYLSEAPDGSIGGLFAAQVVEHLQPDRLVALVDLAYRKLRPGGRVVLETVNPACWAAFFSSYIRDITHVRPVHPDTLRYLLAARGFERVDIRYSSPYPPEAKLQRLPLTALAAGSGVAEIVESFNRNVEILNGQLFTYLDYAAIGDRT